MRSVNAISGHLFSVGQDIIIQQFKFCAFNRSCTEFSTQTYSKQLPASGEKKGMDYDANLTLDETQIHRVLTLNFWFAVIVQQ